MLWCYDMSYIIIISYLKCLVLFECDFCVFDLMSLLLFLSTRCVSTKTCSWIWISFFSKDTVAVRISSNSSCFAKLTNLPFWRWFESRLITVDIEILECSWSKTTTHFEAEPARLSVILQQRDEGLNRPIQGLWFFSCSAWLLGAKREHWVHLTTTNDPKRLVNIQLHGLFALNSNFLITSLRIL